MNQVLLSAAPYALHKTQVITRSVLGGISNSQQAPGLDRLVISLISEN